MLWATTVRLRTGLASEGPAGADDIVLLKFDSSGDTYTVIESGPPLPQSLETTYAPTASPASPIFSSLLAQRERCTLYDGVRRA